MKINKTLIILSLLLVFCISLGVVSAADNADMGVSDINGVATVESSINMDDEISTVSGGEIHKSSEIAEEISNAEGTYYINNNYVIDKTWGEIKDGVTIDGQGHTIYGNGNRAFEITAGNVAIKNLNFVNCFAEDGGAIYQCSEKLTVSDCNFIRCKAQCEGGAIYGYDGEVNNCNFVNCSADDNGGVILWNTFGGVLHCDFYGCTPNNPVVVFVRDGYIDKYTYDKYAGSIAGHFDVWDHSPKNDNGSVLDLKQSSKGIPMEHTGNPLIAFLIALICLPIIRRK